MATHIIKREGPHVINYHTITIEGQGAAAPEPVAPTFTHITQIGDLLDFTTTVNPSPNQTNPTSLHFTAIPNNNYTHTVPNPEFVEIVLDYKSCDNSFFLFKLDELSIELVNNNLRLISLTQGFTEYAVRGLVSLKLLNKLGVTNFYINDVLVQSLNYAFTDGTMRLFATTGQAVTLDVNVHSIYVGKGSVIPKPVNTLISLGNLTPNKHTYYNDGYTLQPLRQSYNDEIVGRQIPNRQGRYFETFAPELLQEKLQFAIAFQCKDLSGVYTTTPFVKLIEIIEGIATIFKVTISKLNNSIAVTTRAGTSYIEHIAFNHTNTQLIEVLDDGTNTRIYYNSDKKYTVGTIGRPTAPVLVSVLENSNPHVVDFRVSGYKLETGPLGWGGAGLGPPSLPSPLDFKLVHGFNYSSSIVLHLAGGGASLGPMDPTTGAFPVTKLKDMSPYQNEFELTDATHPIYQHYNNGKPYLSSTGNSHFKTESFNVKRLYDDNKVDCTIFYVAKFTPGGQNGTLFWFGSPDATDRALIHPQYTSTGGYTIYIDNHNSNRISHEFAAAKIEAPHLVTFRQNNTDVRMWFNNAISATKTRTLTTAAIHGMVTKPAHIFGSSRTNLAIDQFYELIWFNRALSDSEIRSYQNQILSKYNIG